MLVKVPQTRWVQDEGVGEIIEYFNQPDLYNKWDKLNHKHFTLIEKEMERCRADFSYAARNYFWIQDKETRRDILFRLTEGQQLLLEVINDLKAKGRSQRIIVIKARQLGALDPDTKVLTSDLRWVPIGDLMIGTELVAVDEMASKGGNGRKMLPATVLKRWEVFKQAYRITLENGVSVVATEDHPFLSRTRGGTTAKWVETRKLRIGDVLRIITEPWEQGDCEDGWYGGLLDGEGCLRSKRCGGVEIGPSQTFNGVYYRAHDYLVRKGYTFHVDIDRRPPGHSKLGNKEVAKLLVNRMDQVFRLIGQTRPARFVNAKWWVGKGLPGKRNGFGWMKIVSIEPLGERRMVDIETSTGTFIAEGIVTHNCSTLAEGLIAWRTFFFTNINSLIVSFSPEHAAYLFSITQHFYDMLPWWLKPMCASREFKTGMVLDNPDYEARAMNPGLNSRIQVNWANAMTGVGQGVRLSTFHGCLHPDTKIHIADGRTKRMVDIAPGDKVLTSSGRFAPVKHVWKSPKQNEESVRLKLWGNYDFLETTDDHPILTPSGFVRADSLKRGDYVAHPVRPITDEKKHITLKVYPSGGDHANKAYRGITVDVPTDIKLGWLIGFYLAEGCIHHNSRLSPEFAADGVAFGIHRDEESHILENLRDVSLGLPRNPKVYLYRNKNSLTTRLDYRSSALARFLDAECGHKDQKRIPDWVWQCGPEFCQALVFGYISGDGHISIDERDVRATSIRLPILLQLRDLVASLGCGWSCLTHREAGHYYGRNCAESWTWRACGSTNNRLRELLGTEPGIASKRAHWRYSPDRRFVYIEVAEAQRGFSESFYDLEVDAPEHDFCTIHCCVKNSEWADWSDAKAQDIIEEDVLNALDDGPETFAILESTPKGAGRYAHKLWVDSERLGEKSMWTPVFLPWFFDRSHRLTVPITWKPQQDEADMREKIRHDWVRCDNALCRQFHRKNLHGREFTDTPCPTCEGAGVLREFVISDEQLAWMEWRRQTAENNEKSLQKLKQEQATTAEESFVLSGIKLFSDKSMSFAANTVRDGVEGFLDKTVKFHGVNMATGKCYLDGCLADHTYDHEQKGLVVYKWPDPAGEYVMGCDVGEGIGQDYSVASIIKINKYGGPDEQVAVWARNDVDNVTYAEWLNKLGRFYNNALAVVEVNKFDTTETHLRLNLQYPNCYVTKNVGSANILTSRFGWTTNQNTKPRLYQNLRKRLDSRLFLIRDRLTVEELKFFRKDDDSGKTGAASGYHDDRVMATQIALYAAHELDWDEENGIIRVKIPLTLETAPWIFTCRGCGKVWPAASALEYYQCHDCGSMHIEARQNREPVTHIAPDPAYDDEGIEDEDGTGLPDYDLL